MNKDDFMRLVAFELMSAVADMFDDELAKLGACMTILGRASDDIVRQTSNDLDTQYTPEATSTMMFVIGVDVALRHPEWARYWHALLPIGDEDAGRVLADALVAVLPVPSEVPS